MVYVKIENTGLIKECGIRKIELVTENKSFAKGSFAHVYFGRLNHDGISVNKVAVKKIKPTYFTRKLNIFKALYVRTDTKVSDSILGTEIWYVKKEMKYLKLTEECPFVPKYFGSAKEGNRILLVMEACRELSMYDLLCKIFTDIIPSEVALYLFTGIMEGLRWLHSKGILHRDIKPENILLGTDNIPKIADFGLAIKVKNGVFRTRRKTTTGTMYYVSPEKFTEQKYDTRSDCWSLAIVFAQLVFRRPIKKFFSYAPVPIEICARAYEYKSGDEAEKKRIRKLFEKDFGGETYQTLKGNSEVWELVFLRIIQPLSVVDVENRSSLFQLEKDTCLENFFKLWRNDSLNPHSSDIELFNLGKTELETHLTD